MVTTWQWFAALFKAALSVTDQLTHCLGVNVAFTIFAREAKWASPSFSLQALELVQSKI